MIVARIALVLARASGLAVPVLGFLFWAGYAQTLITVHMALGVILVLAL